MSDVNYMGKKSIIIFIGSKPLSPKPQVFGRWAQTTFDEGVDQSYDDTKESRVGIINLA